MNPAVQAAVRSVGSGTWEDQSKTWCNFTFLFFCPPDAPSQPALAIKEEGTSRESSEHGEEEMEVDSADEQEEEGRSQGSQVSRVTNTGASFNTLSSLSTLKPGTPSKWTLLKLT